MGEITTIGLDLAKNIFQVHGVDETGTAVVLSRTKHMAHRSRKILRLPFGHSPHRASGRGLWVNSERNFAAASNVSGKPDSG